MKIGIDAGGTLVKVAYRGSDNIGYQTFPSQDIDDAVSWLYDTFENPTVCITGGKSQLLAEKLMAPAKTLVEFDATNRGIQFLAGQQRHSFENNFMFVNVGTGTSIHHVNEGEQQRIGGSGIGGGTLMGLAYLLTGVEDYARMVKLASNGDRGNVDLKVKDIFEGALPPISGDLTASNFGKKESMLAYNPSASDILASIIGMIGEVIVTISSQMAAQYNVGSIVYIGSSFLSNPLLRDIIEEYTKLAGKEPVFLEKGEYCGALGSLLSLD
ncbi:type II pantothenate kinase [Virgibacillus litoralis]|uniref:Type II pantothenate kinase n=1 Tax=Virgibacillus litoralis TaxID=578221 RepID=A0ABS4HEA5_9BACI|nr:type II pantothenate kinase [Virgibacillus litoralis]MBP1949257.1 type II pantothenate kinase [Virgibacillus litoralis]